MNGFSKSRDETDPNCTPRVRLLHLRRHLVLTQGPFSGTFGGGLRGVLFEARDDPTLWGVDDYGNEVSCGTVPWRKETTC